MEENVGVYIAIIVISAMFLFIMWQYATFVKAFRARKVISAWRNTMRWTGMGKFRCLIDEGYTYFEVEAKGFGWRSGYFLVHIVDEKTTRISIPQFNRAVPRKQREHNQNAIVPTQEFLDKMATYNQPGGTLGTFLSFVIFDEDKREKAVKTKSLKESRKFIQAP